MITIDSLVEKCGNLFPITLKKTTDNNTLIIYIFNGDPYDTDIVLAKLSMDTLSLEVINGGDHDLALGFYEGWLFDSYDWSDLEYFDLKDAPKVLLNSDISEEQFFYEILGCIYNSLEEEIYVQKDEFNKVKKVMKELSPIVKQQTLEATK